MHAYQYAHEPTGILRLVANYKTETRGILGILIRMQMHIVLCKCLIMLIPIIPEAFAQNYLKADSDAYQGGDEEILDRVGLSLVETQDCPSYLKVRLVFR